MLELIAHAERVMQDGRRLATECTARVELSYLALAANKIIAELDAIDLPSVEADRASLRDARHEALQLRASAFATMRTI
jgi:hypothetical protein